MGIRLWQAVSPAKTKLGSLPAKYAEPSLAQSDLLCVFLPVVFYRGCKKRSPGSPVAAFSIQLYPKNRSQPSLKKRSQLGYCTWHSQANIAQGQRLGCRFPQTKAPGCRKKHDGFTPGAALCALCLPLLPGAALRDPPGCGLGLASSHPLPWLFLGF